jgi:signal transduction histidine kinase
VDQPCPDRPQPTAYQPRLGAWSHVWRTLLVLLIGGGIWATVLPRQSVVLVVADVACGLLAIIVVFFRRRWPMGVALVTMGLATVSSLANGAAVLAGVSLATRRRWLEVITLAVLSFATSYIYPAIQPVEDEPWWLTAMVSALAIGATIAWGMYIGSRRELLWSLRNRVERAEAEQELRVAQSRSTERERIAREMHDVLAHRISQISMHAGALAFRGDLTADQLRQGAGEIQSNANEALTDLRGVLGVLRDEHGELMNAPQPTYEDVATLVDEARGTGMAVNLADRLPPGAPVPEVAGRTVYRIVQEGLTNARKHAPGSVLSIELDGSPEDGIDVVLRNPLGFGATVPGSGLGLIGLAERAELRGGRLEHGRDGAAFVLRGWIPWAA